MENNFFNYITKQLQREEVDLWMTRNNIFSEKMDLYYDFCRSLYLKLSSTFLGDEDLAETKTEMTNEDNLKHFNWCWKQLVDDFKKENIIFELEGEHYEYFQNFFDEISQHYSEGMPGTELLLFNSNNYLEIATNRGNASQLLGLKLNSNIMIEFYN